MEYISRKLENKTPLERLIIRDMIYKICGTEETDNPDGICDDCKFCIIDNTNIILNF